MVEKSRTIAWLAHTVLICGVAVIGFPLYLAFVASTHSLETLLQGRIPLLPGTHLIENYGQILTHGVATASTPPVGLMLVNSMVMALGIALGKIAISIIAAYAIVYFAFPLRMACFWIIFVTLMLPVEVRILPTYKVVADLGMIDSFAGLTIPLIASATATLLFRQFFLTIPDELVEAAKIDGAGPLRFLWDTVIIGIKRALGSSDALTDWGAVMATAMLAMLPPVAVVVLMQRWFVKGLVDSEK